ncbi:MAG: Flp family type IVb pilin [Acidobacteria bacterium]|jgi:Flp pilus assembly pilin Flp|nr:MAG: Flp family type IVb pilin [Acidobacteriota bacterium]
MEHVLAAVSRLVRRDDGQDLIEYGLLAVLIAVVVMVGVTSVGQAIMSVFWTSIAQNF